MSRELNVSPEDLARALLETFVSYQKDVVSLARGMRVSKEKLPESLAAELVFYGLETWRTVEKVLKVLGAEGCFEMVGFELDPTASALEVELMALEGSPYRADSLVISWSPDGVRLDVLYYVEEQPKGELPHEWSYLPDERAVEVTFWAEKFADLPPLAKVDEEARKLGL
ncbi:MAG: hypothetical protein NZ902_05445 [Acidilobaceae archaeon]|nr:hypothetical protein [Acidilobaceae archaeon]MCX8166010.1 hypothetical protein [Acidilobaceae archaeon]MDW7974651.1 hypothetical protein [Sulfolobales archaeon]